MTEYYSGHNTITGNDITEPQTRRLLEQHHLFHLYITFYTITYYTTKAPGRYLPNSVWNHGSNNKAWTLQPCETLSYCNKRWLSYCIVQAIFIPSENYCINRNDTTDHYPSLVTTWLISHWIDVTKKIGCTQRFDFNENFVPEAPRLL